MFNNPLDFIKKNAVWITLIFGLLLAIAYFYGATLDMNFFGSENTKGLVLSGLQTLMGACFGGGIFACILKSLQFNNVFSEELEKIIYSEKFVSSPKDVEKIWLKVSDGLYPSHKMVTARKKIHIAILQHYLPHTLDFYYERSDHAYTLTWANEEKTKVLVENQNELTVIAETVDPIVLSPTNSLLESDQSVSYSASFYEITGKGRAKKETLIKPTSPPVSKVSKKVANDENEIEYTHSITLSGKKQYKVLRKCQYELDLEEDRFVLFGTTRPLMGLNVRVVKPDDLKCNIVPAGLFDEFEDICVSGSREMNVKYENIVFPEQGYLILLG
jgi:hypothetical protein